MAVSRYVRTSGALGHLLLVVVLAFGVFVMHTVGHPTEAHGSGTGHATVREQPAAHSSEDSPHAAPADHPASTDLPVGTGDMTSLCVAVLLAAWVLTALARSALARDPDGRTRLRARALAAWRPGPPPPRGPDLTRLSVLRL
ncbi:DUF6153 family protein [Streptomyces sp. NPDC094143]|uniref:DUF6153 family protein n=1 Tax=Streptomyces sp. NPDC094143 TaxID=3155310 RepID=UPI0033226C34